MSKGHNREVVLTSVIKRGYVGHSLTFRAADEPASKRCQITHATDGADHIESPPTLNGAFDNGVEGLAACALHEGRSSRVLEHQPALVADNARVVSLTEAAWLERLGTAGHGGNSFRILYVEDVEWENGLRPPQGHCPLQSFSIETQNPWKY